ncbi:Ephrin-B2 [Halotydeus destructor]|nr:Ephrin-B2 [Halotydeus destructor]
MPWIICGFVLMAIFGGSCMELASSARLPDIYWNISNPIFRIDNTDHIIDVNRGNNQFEYDQVNLICPTYPKGTRAEDTESYIIYNVSKEEYNSCSITSRARIIAVCDKPHQLMYFTITFRSFTPQPGGLEFKPGQDYYFMSTSDGTPSGVNHKFGGRCATHNMKVVFKVCCGDALSSSASSSSSSPSSSSSSSSSSLSSSDASSSAASNSKSNGTSSPRMEDSVHDKSNKSSAISLSSPGGGSLSPSLAMSGSSRPGSMPSIIITTIKPPSLSLNNTASKANYPPGSGVVGGGSSSSSASSLGDPLSLPSSPAISRSFERDMGNYNSNNKPPAAGQPAQRRFGPGSKNTSPHLTPLWGSAANSPSGPHEAILSPSVSTPRPPLAMVTPSHQVTSTPYWWRPHFTKVPSVRANGDNSHQGSDSSGWPPGSASNGASGSGGSKPRKTGAWVLVVGSGLAVLVACFIVCGLFACTNYLFFPPRRKDQTEIGTPCR